jgi:uncharacterized small protein (DUF1192 family)
MVHFWIPDLALEPNLALVHYGHANTELRQMDLENEPRPKATIVIGEKLDEISIAELEQRIQTLDSEIARIRAEIVKKQAGKAAAAAFFKI